MEVCELGPSGGRGDPLCGVWRLAGARPCQLAAGRHRVERSRAARRRRSSNQVTGVQCPHFAPVALTLALPWGLGSPEPGS